MRERRACSTGSAPRLDRASGPLASLSDVYCQVVADRREADGVGGRVAHAPVGLGADGRRDELLLRHLLQGQYVVQTAPSTSVCRSVPNSSPTSTCSTVSRKVPMGSGCRRGRGLSLPGAEVAGGHRTPAASLGGTAAGRRARAEALTWRRRGVRGVAGRSPVVVPRPGIRSNTNTDPTVTAASAPATASATVQLSRRPRPVAGGGRGGGDRDGELAGGRGRRHAVSGGASRGSGTETGTGARYGFVQRHHHRRRPATPRTGGGTRPADRTPAPSDVRLNPTGPRTSPPARSPGSAAVRQLGPPAPPAPPAASRPPPAAPPPRERAAGPPPRVSAARRAPWPDRPPPGPAARRPASRVRAPRGPRL